MSWKSAIATGAAVTAAALILGKLFGLGRDQMKETIKELDTLIANANLLDEKGLQILQLRVGILNAKLLESIDARTKDQGRGQELVHREWSERVADDEARHDAAAQRGIRSVEQNDEMIDILKRIARQVGVELDDPPIVQPDPSAPGDYPLPGRAP